MSSEQKDRRLTLCSRILLVATRHPFYTVWTAMMIHPSAWDRRRGWQRKNSWDGLGDGYMRQAVEALESRVQVLMSI